MLGIVYHVAYGLRLYLEQRGDLNIQKMSSDGSGNRYYIRNVFLFAPSDVLPAYAIYAPEAMQSSIISE